MKHFSTEKSMLNMLALASGALKAFESLEALRKQAIYKPLAHVRPLRTCKQIIRKLHGHLSSEKPTQNKLVMSLWEN